MPNNTKARSLEIYTAACSALEAVGGVVKIDQTDQLERYPILRKMADIVVEKTGCTLEAARRNIAKAMRKARWAEMVNRWGGHRPGAGRKTKAP